jgi:hypothetical protein
MKNIKNRFNLFAGLVAILAGVATAVHLIIANQTATQHFILNNLDNFVNILLLVVLFIPTILGVILCIKRNSKVLNILLMLMSCINLIINIAILIEGFYYMFLIIAILYAITLLLLPFGLFGNERKK